MNATSLLLVLLFLPLTSLAQVYHCVGSKGEKIMQQTPCPGGAKVMEASQTTLSAVGKEQVRKRTAFCRFMTDDYAAWVVNASRDLGKYADGVEGLRRNVERNQDYDPGVTSRVSMRATILLGKNLSRAEARADLYAVCMAME